MNPASLQPRHNYVLIHIIEASESINGIVIPDSVRKKQKVRARVVSFGDGIRLDSGELIPLGLKVGDLVLMDGRQDMAGIPGADHHFLITEDAIMAVIDPLLDVDDDKPSLLIPSRIPVMT